MRHLFGRTVAVGRRVGSQVRVRCVSADNKVMYGDGQHGGLSVRLKWTTRCGRPANLPRFRRHFFIRHYFFMCGAVASWIRKWWRREEKKQQKGIYARGTHTNILTYLLHLHKSPIRIISTVNLWRWAALKRNKNELISISGPGASGRHVPCACPYHHIRKWTKNENKLENPQNKAAAFAVPLHSSCHSIDSFRFDYYFRRIAIYFLCDSGGYSAAGHATDKTRATK